MSKEGRLETGVRKTAWEGIMRGRNDPLREDTYVKRKMEVYSWPPKLCFPRCKPCEASQYPEGDTRKEIVTEEQTCEMGPPSSYCT